MTDEQIREELQWRKYQEHCRQDTEKWNKIEKNLEKFFGVTLAGCILTVISL